MSAPQEFNLLVVSDLHVSEGRRAGTGRFSRIEDFFFDAEFARFLGHYRGGAGGGALWNLVIAGDFLDLLQVLPQAGGGYGLPCGEQESIDKLRVLARGHRGLFEALASFVAAGHRLTIMKGNHDPELHYPGVQAALVAELALAFQRLSPPPPGASGANISAANVLFADWFYYEEGVVWIEHGNQYERWNAFRTFLSPLLPPRPGAPRNDDIDLPLGSFFVRYLFNRIELAEPFADNIKPAGRFIRWFLTRHFITAMAFLFGDGRHMVGRIRRALQAFDPAGLALRRQQHDARLAALASAPGAPTLSQLTALDAGRAKNVLEETEGILPTLITTLIRFRLALVVAASLVIFLAATALLASAQVVGVLVPPFGTWLATVSLPLVGLVQPRAVCALKVVLGAVAVLGLWWTFRPAPKGGRDDLAKAADGIARTLGVPAVVMGHTHDPALYPLAGGGEYFNTGSWTKVFSDDERLVRDDVELVFLQGIRRSPGPGLKLKLMEWDDAAGEPRLLKLFED